MSLTPPFLCPLCGSNRCLLVYVDGRTGGKVKMPWYSCAGCTVMFVDPERFEQVVRSTFTSCGAGGRATLEEVPQRPTRALLEKPIGRWAITKGMADPAKGRE